MGAARRPLSRTPGLEFYKLFGTGSGEGFTLWPNTAVWAILAVWRDEAAAAAGLGGPVFVRWRARAAETWTIRLSALSARGRWSGAAPFPVDAGRAHAGADANADAKPEAEGPFAVLTRATIKPAKALKFWGRAPAISAVIGADPNVLFKIGLGEAPGFQQVTFSIWPDLASMARFARGDGPHGRAIRAVREGGWFREELYARFRITGLEGAWSGAPAVAAAPSLQHLKTAA